MHSQFSLEKIVDLKKQYPDALILAHPECKRDILLVADKVGSTAALLRFATQSDCKRFIVATESGILHEMKKNNPDKEFIPAPPNDSTCACNECNFMRLNTMKKLYNTLKYELPEVIVDKELSNLYSVCSTYRLHWEFKKENNNFIHNCLSWNIISKR